MSARTRNPSDEDSSVSKTTQNVLVRVAFIFFALQVLPLDWKYWRLLFSADWLHPRLQDFFHLSTYTPRFINAPQWGLGSYANWGLILAIALVVGAVWAFFDRRKSADLYYCIRFVLRYRLALAMIAYGVLMCFQLLFPKPTLSDLNTNYGDFLPWKIYYLTAGVASAHYQQALGLLEILGAVLLLSERTAMLGAGLIAALLGNIVAASVAFQLGDHVYASLLLLIAVFLCLHDMPRLYDLLLRESLARADTYKPVFATRYIGVTRTVLTSFIVIFAMGLSLQAYRAEKAGGWLFPQVMGLENAAGLYNVKEFVINGKTLPYSRVDPLRWQDVVLEPWNTFSVRVNRPVAIRLATPSMVGSDIVDYEVTGNGGRHFYTYTIGKDGTLIVESKNDPKNKLSLKYSRPGERELVLDGTDSQGNSLHIVLERIDKRYLVQIGRRHPLKLY